MVNENNNLVHNSMVYSENFQINGVLQEQARESKWKRILEQAN